MEYFTVTDRTVLFSMAAGLFGGVLNSAVEITLKWWNQEALVGQQELVARALLRGVIQAIFLGAGAFVLMLYATEMTLQAINQFLFFWALAFGLALPIFNRAWDWLFSGN